MLCRSTRCSVKRWYGFNSLKAQEIKYALSEADLTLKQQGTYSDKIRLERKSKREQKTGRPLMSDCSADKLHAKHKKLAAKEDDLRERLAVSSE